MYSERCPNSQVICVQTVGDVLCDIVHDVVDVQQEQSWGEHASLGDTLDSWRYCNMTVLLVGHFYT